MLLPPGNTRPLFNAAIEMALKCTGGGEWEAEHVLIADEAKLGKDSQHIIIKFEVNETISLFI